MIAEGHGAPPLAIVAASSPSPIPSSRIQLDPRNYRIGEGVGQRYLPAAIDRDVIDLDVIDSGDPRSHRRLARRPSMPITVSRAEPAARWIAERLAASDRPDATAYVRKWSSARRLREPLHAAVDGGEHSDLAN